MLPPYWMMFRTIRRAVMDVLANTRATPLVAIVLVIKTGNSPKDKQVTGKT